MNEYKNLLNILSNCKLESTLLCAIITDETYIIVHGVIHYRYDVNNILFDFRSPIELIVIAATINCQQKSCCTKNSKVKDEKLKNGNDLK